jgi:hypothetical protein
MPMPYTEEEGGRLNNFAIEPKMYQAEPPTEAQKRNSIVLIAVTGVLVAIGICVAYLVS